MCLYLILRSGLYARVINGREEVADRTVVVAARRTHEEIRALLMQAPTAEGGWRDVNVSWADSIEVDAAPVWE